VPALSWGRRWRALARVRRVAALTGTSNSAGASSLPARNRFTWSSTPTRESSSPAGTGRPVLAAAVHGNTIASGTTFYVWDGETVGVSPVEPVQYDTFTVTVDEAGSLAGTAAGSLIITCGGCADSVPFTAVLTGTADRHRAEVARARTGRSVRSLQSVRVRATAANGHGAAGRRGRRGDRPRRHHGRQ
jgi:hypothetical protein